MSRSLVVNKSHSPIDCGERDRFEIIDTAVVVVVEVLAVAEVAALMIGSH